MCVEGLLEGRLEVENDHELGALDIIGWQYLLLARDNNSIRLPPSFLFSSSGDGFTERTLSLHASRNWPGISRLFLRLEKYVI